LSGGVESQIGSLWRKGEESEAMTLAQRYRDAFGDDFYLEVMPLETYEQADFNRFLFQMAKIEGFRIVAGNDCRYPTADKAQFYDYLYMIDKGWTASDGIRDPLSKNRYLRSRAEMRDGLLEQRFPEALVDGWLDRTVSISESIELIKFSNAFKVPVFQASEVEMDVPRQSAIGIGESESEDDLEEDEEFALTGE
jgi:DNA polymerase III alpha subunit